MTQVRAALANFGSPILQGGLSSFLATLILAGHPYYISMVLFPDPNQSSSS